MSIPSQKKFIQIKPTNNASANEYTYKNGVSTIDFDIPAQPALLRAKTIRFSGICSILQGASENGVNKRTNNASSVSPFISRIDSRVGLHSLIDNITISSSQTGTVYETIKNYNRLASMLLTQNNALSDYQNEQGMLSGALGKESSTSKLCDCDFAFSLNFFTGFLNAEVIDLLLVGGLRISIYLNSDVDVIYDNNYLANAETDASSGGGSFFKIKDLSLNYDLDIIKDPKQLQVLGKAGQWSYNSWSSFFQNLQSNIHQSSINISKASVRTVLMNMCPSNFSNNYSRNGQLNLRIMKSGPINGETRNSVICPLSKVLFLRNGLRYPLNYEMESDNGLNPAELVLQGLNGEKYTALNKRFLQSQKTLSNGALVADSRFTNEASGDDAINAFVIAMNYSHISGGANFKNTPLQFRLESDTFTDQTPQSLFIFVNSLNTVTIQKGNVNIVN